MPTAAATRVECSLWEAGGVGGDCVLIEGNQLPDAFCTESSMTPSLSQRCDGRSAIWRLAALDLWRSNSGRPHDRLLMAGIRRGTPLAPG